MKLKAKPQIPKLKKTSSPDKAASVTTQEQVDIRNAVRLYLRECGVARFSPFKRRVLRERPWYLVIGPEGSGKTTLLSSSGIDFPVMYPSQEDGYIPHESTQPPIVWWFGLEAVWLDLPGRLLSPENQFVFNNVIDGLRQTRPGYPVDGIILVIPSVAFVEADVDAVQELAKSQRKIVEHLMQRWGIEVPVYLLFSRTDEVMGFDELFYDPQGRWDERILGASIDDIAAQGLPRISFLQKFEKVILNLNDIRLRMLANEKNEDRRSAMCRFPIDIAAMREKTALFIALLFKQGTYQERPRFGGFFFVSCQKSTSSFTQPSSKSPSATEERMLNHPLNPRSHGKKIKKMVIGSRMEFRSFFLRPLLTTIIPKQASAGVNATRYRFRNDLLMLMLRIGVTALLSALLICIPVRSFLKIRNEERSVKAILDKEASTTIEGLLHCGVIDSLYQVYRKPVSGFTALGNLISGFDRTRIFEVIASTYGRKCVALIVDPCVVALEKSLKRRLGFADEQYRALKNDLRAYCFLTDMRLKYPEITREDSMVLKTLEALITERIIPEAAQPKYGTLVDNLVQKSLFFIGARNATSPLPSANAALVSRTQERLLDLMDNREVYEIIISQVKNGCDDLELRDLLSDAPNVEVFRCTKQLSEAYTPEVWRKRILPEMRMMNRQRQNIERWAIGSQQDDHDALITNVNPTIGELIGFYLEDVTLQWRDLFLSTTIEPFATPQEAERALRLLCAKKSPLDKMLQHFAEWVAEFSIDDTTISSRNDLNKSFVRQNSYLQEFIDDYLQDYRMQLEGIADKLSKAYADKSIALSFNGSDDDPLIVAHRFMEGTVQPFLETDAGACLEPFLSTPIKSVRSVLVKPLQDELNTVWGTRVFHPFVNSYLKKYPFINSKSEVPFDATRSFFHPTQGNIWNTINQYLANRIVERGGQWVMLDKPGMVPVALSSTLPGVLHHARRITNVLFDPDGTPHQWTITIIARRHDFTNVHFTVNGTDSPFGPGKSVVITWPQRGIDVAGSLSAVDVQGNQGILSFGGSWSMMKLMNNVCAYEGPGSASPNFTVEWKIKAHAITLPFPVQVMVSSDNHPLCSNVFKGFSVPEKVAE